MREFTKEELDLLKEAEPYFRTAVYSDYKRATIYRIDKLVADIWDAAADSPTPRNFACGRCSFNLYKKVGEKYYKDLEIVGKELEPTKENKDIENNTVTNKKQKCQTRTIKHRTKD